jgi:hypothetical protein
MPDAEAIEEAVRKRYAASACEATNRCTTADGSGAGGSVLAASIGCANPVAVADLPGFESVSITDGHPVADGFTSVIIEATNGP